MSRPSVRTDGWEEPDPGRRHFWYRIALAVLGIQLLIAAVALWNGWSILGVGLAICGLVGCPLFLRYGPYAKRL